MDEDGWLAALALATLAATVGGLLVPLYVVVLGGGAPALGLLGALSSVAAAPAAVLAGRYADRTGDDRGVVLAGFGALAVALAVLPALSSVAAVVAVGAALSAAVGAVGPVATSLAVAGADEADWTARIARLNTVQGYGATAGLLVGTAWLVGVATRLDPAGTRRSLFVVVAAVAAAATALAARSLPAGGDRVSGRRRTDRLAAVVARAPRSLRDATFDLGRARFYWGYRALSAWQPGSVRRRLSGPLGGFLAGAALFFAGFGAFWAPLPLYLTAGGLRSGPVFGLYLLNNVASTLLFGVAGRAVARAGPRLVGAGALGTRAAAFLGVGALGVAGLADLLAPASLLAVGALLVVVGASWAFVAVAGSALVAGAAPSGSRGGALGVYAAVGAAASAAGSLLGGTLAASSFPLAFGVAAGLVVAGAGVVVATGAR